MALFTRSIHRSLKPLTQTRALNLQEYQSKGLMDQYGVTIQPFLMADSGSGATDAASTMLSKGASEIVLKAQILAGGRGKGVFSSGLKGGVKISKDPSEIGSLTEQMIGYNLTTKQTSAEGTLVSKVMVAKALNIVKETYLAIVMDRSYGGPVIIASPDGGVDIEEVAESTPERVFKVAVDVNTGISEEIALDLAAKLEFEGAAIPEAAAQIQNLYQLFAGVDATQVEVNPFGLTDENEVVCFDAKINFDDNASFRQKDIFAMEDTSETDPRELEAAKSDLNYIGMDGNIACMVNGAGLAMATMDIIQLHGGSPANFLDVGGKVQEEQVEKAFNILTMDPKVKAILVNIFGGIVDCRVIANGIVAACNKTGLELPMVVRLQGSNMDEARDILDKSGLDIITAQQFNDAAAAAVAAVSK